MLILQKFSVMSSLNNPSERQRTLSTIFTDHSLKPLLNFETTSGTEQMFVCCLQVRKVREVVKYLLGPSIWTCYLLLTTTAGEDKIIYSFLTSFMGPSSIVVENTQRILYYDVIYVTCPKQY